MVPESVSEFPADESQALQPGESRLVGPIMATLLALLVLGLAALAFLLASNTRPISSHDVEGSLDQRMIRIADQLQCPICEGQSVAFSGSQLAGEMRRQIAEQLEAGKGEDQILEYFVDRYGIKILREPPKQGLNLWLWIIPVAGAVIALVGLVWKLQRMAAAQRRTRKAAVALDDAAPTIDPELQELLAQYDKDLFA